MATLFVRHRVADYAKWRSAYNDFDAERRKLGATSHGVYRLDGDPNDVTVFHEFPTTEAAKTFAASPRLKEVMQSAGVLGKPDIWIATKD